MTRAAEGSANTAGGGEDHRPRRSLPRDRRKRRPPGLPDLLLVLLASLAFVFGVVRPFVVEAFFIPSESMAPALEPGDRVLANKFVYRFSEPERGDLVVFESPRGGGINVKRVVGLPGDRVEIYDGALLVNDATPAEPYVERGLIDSSFFGPETVPEGHVFVLGDNRSNSVDSRSFGAVPENLLLGEAFARFWPPGRTAFLL